MEATTQDILWDTNKIDKQSVSKPLLLMSKQANSLSSLTNGMIEGSIVTISNVDELTQKHSIIYCFTIIAPLIDQSRLTLFCITQPFDKEYPLIFDSDYFEENSSCECNDEDSFKVCLKKIITSESVSAIINGLIAKSRSIEYA